MQNGSEDEKVRSDSGAKPGFAAAHGICNLINELHYLTGAKPRLIYQHMDAAGLRPSREADGLILAKLHDWGSGTDTSALGWVGDGPSSQASRYARNAGKVLLQAWTLTAGRRVPEELLLMWVPATWTLMVRLRNANPETQSVFIADTLRRNIAVLDVAARGEVRTLVVLDGIDYAEALKEIQSFDVRRLGSKSEDDDNSVPRSFDVVLGGEGQRRKAPVKIDMSGVITSTISNLMPTLVNQYNAPEGFPVKFRKGCFSQARTPLSRRQKNLAATHSQARNRLMYRENFFLKPEQVLTRRE